MKIPTGNAEVLLKAENRPERGAMLDRKEYEALLVAIEQSIETSVSRGEHFRGYRRDTHSHGLDRLGRTFQEQDRLFIGSDFDSGDPCLDAISRLNRDCCKGIKPEDI